MTNRDRMLKMVSDLIFSIEYRELNESDFVGLSAREIVWQLRKLAGQVSTEIGEAEVQEINTKELTIFQRQVAEWADKNFGLTPAYRPLLGAVEEIGELTHAQLKKEQDVRKGVSRFEADASDAIGDLLIYLAHYCQVAGLSLQQSVDKTWAKVRQRDWKKFPETGEEPQTGGKTVQGQFLPIIKSQSAKGGEEWR